MATTKARRALTYGGYGSSSKPVSQLATPPRGPAPGASKPPSDAGKPGETK